MSNLEFIVFGSGLQDGISPCVFMACAAFITLGFLFKPDHPRINSLRLAFVLIYVLSFALLNFGPCQVLIFKKPFIAAAKIIYFILGLGALIVGALLFKEWLQSCVSASVKSVDGVRIKPLSVGDLTTVLITAIIALTLAALATIGPINSYIILLGSETLLKNHWQAVLPLLAIYVLANLWPLWIVWALVSVKGLRPSMLKIIYAAIFLTASSCIIFLLKY